jgi:Fe-S oxidoreductase
MLSNVEKIIFLIAATATVIAVLSVIRRIIGTIARGSGKPDWSIVPGRLASTLTKTIALTPVWRTRFWASLFHALVVWGFMFYLLVNIGDSLEGLIAGYIFLGTETVGNLYRLLADVLTVTALVGMAALLIRRFIFNPPELTTREDTLLHPKARKGIRRDSLIVGLFIIFHLGGRFLSKSFQIAHQGSDPWQPFATFFSSLWASMSAAAQVTGEHFGFWVAIGLIMAFFPYFLLSKHLHIFMAPLNFLLTPEYESPGQLIKLNFEDESVEQFGATNLEDLGWDQILDGYACIMCNRCQDACPAYTTGKVLSPAALEINKRYFLNQEGAALAAGEASSQSLLDFAITEEAVLACTACGACTDICPVGNDPMRDIMDIRRSMVLMDNKFPEEWQGAFRGMERSTNPWNIPPTERMKWAEGYNVPTYEQKPDADILWWVGCAPSTDARAQKTAQALAKVLNAADVSFAVLGQREQCTGDSARRAGNEYLFFEMASANVELLNEVAPKRILTTCPHCMHTLENEYPEFGGNYEVVHHTEFIQELVEAGDLNLTEGTIERLTYHDPCYLGRQNDVLIEPRQIIEGTGAQLIEMQQSGQQSFCCGAGGAQMWKEEENGSSRVSEERIRQAQETGADTVALGCPFCMVMLTDAANTTAPELKLLDVAEIVALNIEENDGN